LNRTKARGVSDVRIWKDPLLGEEQNTCNKEKMNTVSGVKYGAFDDVRAMKWMR